MMTVHEMVGGDRPRRGLSEPSETLQLVRSLTLLRCALSHSYVNVSRAETYQSGYVAGAG